MFNVTITYKSGKVEKTQIAIGKYAKAVSDMIAEGRLAGIHIDSVE